MRPYFVGICGGSGSGKTYLLKKLLEFFTEEQVTLISQDNYYKKREEQEKTAEGLINFDHPDSVDLRKLEMDLHKLVEGNNIEIEEYTFNVEDVKPRMLIFKPAPIVIIEGLFIYHRQQMNDFIDMKVYVDADEHIKLTRRLRRDIVERGYSYEDTLRDYEKFVAPMYHRYVAPQKHISDLIVPNNHRMDVAIEVLADHLLKKME